jgi:hypothetical protein
MATARPLVNQPIAASKFARRMVGLTLCYALALQAFLAAFGTAFAVAREAQSYATFAICHSTAPQAPVRDDAGRQATIPCMLCAVAAAAGGLPADSFAIVLAPPTTAGGLSHADTPVIAAAAPVRAGLARAPPQFV